MTPNDQYRHEIFLDSAERLSVIARRVIDDGRASSQVVLMCIDVNDEEWRPLVDHYMPGMDESWDALRETGAVPIARGCVHASIRELLAKMVEPRLAAMIMNPPTNGDVQVFSLAKGGISIYVITPSDHAPSLAEERANGN